MPELPLSKFQRYNRRFDTSRFEHVSACTQLREGLCPTAHIGEVPHRKVHIISQETFLVSSVDVLCVFMSTYDDDDGALLTTGHGKTQCELFCADQPGDFIILQQLMEDSSAGGYSWNCSHDANIGFRPRLLNVLLCIFALNGVIH